VAWKITRKVLASQDRFWHVEDFDGPPMAVVHALSRLVAEGELERVRRGTYWRGHPTRWSGRSHAPPIAAVREVVGADEAIGAAGWMAANTVGLSTQVAAIPIVAVSRRLPTGFDNVRLVSRAQRTGRREARLTDAEVTLLEALEGWDRYSELDPDLAVSRLLAFMSSAEVDPRRLVRAAPTETVAVRERLKALLERAGNLAEAARINGARSEAARARALSVLTSQPSAI
jgi:hypothetical protein